MEHVLVVSPDDWLDGAMRLLDRDRFHVSGTDYSTALETWTRTTPRTVIIGTRGDLGAAASLVRHFWHLGRRRPVLILVGPDSQRAVLQKHATLRQRADGYVTEDTAPEELVSMVERPRVTADQFPKRSWPPALVTSLALIVLVAPLLEARGHSSAARWVTGTGAVLGLASEALARRRGGSARPLLVIGFLLVLTLTVVLRFW